MAHARYTKEEIAARGRAIYEQLRAQLEPEHTGKYMVIDVETGDYELDEDDAVVSRRAHARYPGAPLYGVRVGHSAWGTLGMTGTRAMP